MVDNKSELINSLTKTLGENKYWNERLKIVLEKNSRCSIHLGIFVEPFLQLVLDGKKTIESRFSSVKCAPYNKIKAGDIVLLKKTGGNIVGICQVKSVWFYEIQIDSWHEIKQFAQEICADDPVFWESRKDAKYATLMRISHVSCLSPIKYVKRDRRGWVIIKENTQ